ncbi:MAG TPA: hypothetical protein VGI18_04680 [Burkholderiales bacterium]
MRLRLALVLLVAGCASYSGRGLAPGQSTEADVIATMGAPVETRPGVIAGEKVLWYPRLPYGRASYAARIAADGKLIGIEQRLTEENLERLENGKMTDEQAHDFFGPPWRVDQNPRMQREIWTYQFPAIPRPKVLYLQFSPDHLLREHYYMDDPDARLVPGRILP